MAHRVLGWRVGWWDGSTWWSEAVSFFYVFFMGADLPWRDHGKGALVLQHHPAPTKTLLKRKRIPRPTFRKKGESRSPKKKAAVQFFVEDVGVLSLGALGQQTPPVGSWWKDSPSLPDMCTSMCTWHVKEKHAANGNFFFSILNLRSQRKYWLTATWLQYREVRFQKCKCFFQGNASFDVFQALRHRNGIWLNPRNSLNSLYAMIVILYVARESCHLFSKIVWIRDIIMYPGHCGGYGRSGFKNGQRILDAKYQYELFGSSRGADSEQGSGRSEDLNCDSHLVNWHCVSQCHI